jgi:hypothetical protein
MDLKTAQALVRFGLGRRGDEALPADPAIWLRRQLDQLPPREANRGPAPPMASRPCARIG